MNAAVFSADDEPCLHATCASTTVNLKPKSSLTVHALCLDLNAVDSSQESYLHQGVHQVPHGHRGSDMKHYIFRTATGVSLSSDQDGKYNHLTQIFCLDRESYLTFQHDIQEQHLVLNIPCM